MPRKKKNRHLLAPPSIKGLSVSGANRVKQIILHLEEYETIKLLDYNNMTQEEAAICMCISRPTLTRIYESARSKIAQCMIEGKNILIKGGNFEFDDDWHYCNSCQSKFSIYAKANKICPICSSKELITLNEFYNK